MLSVAAFYAFVPLPNAAALREPLHALCARHGACGTVLLAPEGINGTIAAEPGAMDALLGALRGGPLFGTRLARMPVKRSQAAAMPFGRLKVRLKREIVTLGTPTQPAERTGQRVAPSAWNALISRPDVTVIDTRNGFEVAMGTFAGARDPHLARFGDFPAFVSRHLDPARDRTVAMFCTGGIRCEKASAYLLDRGFADVRQLDGGILRYLADIPAGDSLWRGDCFVFDGRVALGHGLAIAA